MNGNLQKVGFIGMGIMGSSMSQNLLKNGFAVTVYNRDRKKTDPAKVAGAEVADTPLEVGSSVSILCLCVTNGAAVREMLFGENGALTGKMKPNYVLDFSTIAPNDAICIAKDVESAGSEFLDCPVTGGDVGAKNGTLTIMVGGSPEGFSTISSVLAAIGKKIIYMGASGCGQLTKCANQLAGALSIIAMTEAIVFAKAAGLDLEKTLEVVGSGSAGSWAILNYAPRVLRGDLAPGFYAKDLLKDLTFVANAAEELDVSLEASSLAKDLYERFCSSGGATLGSHGLIKLWDRG